ncbi:MAG TPA: CoA-transferase [Chloroflexia bacterium]|nr:CoA-transferase [Chloroflexia bacterium]
MSDDYKAKLRAGSDPLVFFKREDELEDGGIAPGHTMAAAISHALHDGETLFVGANPLIPFAGARLAQLTHAPNLTMIAGASGGVNPLLDPLAPSSGDYANLVAEAVLPFQEVLMMFMGGHGDVFFAGGLQIDRYGNCNLATVGSHEKTKLRGPGSAGIPWASRARRTILYTTAHTGRVFVPKVDFVSLAGWPVGGGTSAHGPALVVTPLALMDFTPEGTMRLVSVHAGVSLADVIDNTGFDLVLPEGQVPTTPQPTTEEMILMRTFDLDGLLAIIVP